MSVAVKSDPRIWEESKARACSHAGLCDHSARKMQWAVRDYKQRGGRYVGSKRREQHNTNKLSQWTRQRWRTSSGQPSRGRRRYLPEEAWKRLTPDQIARTNAAKRRGHALGKQYVRQPTDVSRVASRVRRESAESEERGSRRRSGSGYRGTRPRARTRGRSRNTRSKASLSSSSSSSPSSSPPWMSYAAAHAHEAKADAHGVSKVARARGGFMRLYETHGRHGLERLAYSPNLTWARRRDHFVARHMAQYSQHPTYRRWLALVMWAYEPPGKRPAR